MSRSYRRPFASPAGYGFSLAKFRRVATRHFRRRINQQVRVGEFERAEATNPRQSSLKLQNEFDSYAPAGPVGPWNRSICRAKAEGDEWRVSYWMKEAIRLRRK